MARRPSKQGLSTGILIVLLAGVLVSQTLGASANHTPADKVVAAGSTLEVIGANNTVPILTARFKTSKPTDLLLHLTLECSIWTRLITGTLVGTGDNASSANAEGKVDIHLTMDGTTIVPITSSSQPPQDGRTVLEEKEVTFCNDIRTRTVTDSEQQGTGDPPDGQDTIDDFLATKSANAFNWILLNAGSGMHEIVVHATFTTNAGGTNGGSGQARAAVGTRTLIVGTEKMSNDTVVAPIGTS